MVVVVASNQPNGDNQMAVDDEITVQRYATQHSQMLAMLNSLAEFVGTMPAPDENGNIPGVDYGYVGDVARIHGLLKQANDLAYEVTE